MVVFVFFCLFVEKTNNFRSLIKESLANYPITPALFMLSSYIHLFNLKSFLLKNKKNYKKTFYLI